MVNRSTLPTSTRAAEWFAAAERASVGDRDVRDVRDVVESLVGLVASAEDPTVGQDA